MMASAGADERVHLSPRERQLVALILEDLSRQEIADVMMLSVYTVDSYIERLTMRLPADGNRGGMRRIRRYFRGQV